LSVPKYGAVYRENPFQAAFLFRRGAGCGVRLLQKNPRDETVPRVFCARESFCFYPGPFADILGQDRRSLTKEEERTK